MEMLELLFTEAEAKEAPKETLVRETVIEGQTTNPTKEWWKGYWTNTRSGHNKFYEITKTDDGATLRWGRIGTNGQNKAVTVIKAIEQNQKRESKGYIKRH